MSKTITRNQANNSSLFQFVKSLFQGKPATAPVQVQQPFSYPKSSNCVTIDVNTLSPQARMAYDQLFDSLFSNVQSSKA